MIAINDIVKLNEASELNFIFPETERFLVLDIRFASGYGIVVDLECTEGEIITSGIYNFESIYGVI